MKSEQKQYPSSRLVQIIEDTLTTLSIVVLPIVLYYQGVSFWVTLAVAQAITIIAVIVFVSVDKTAEAALTSGNVQKRLEHIAGEAVTAAGTTFIMAPISIGLAIVVMALVTAVGYWLLLVALPVVAVMLNIYGGRYLQRRKKQRMVKEEQAKRAQARKDAVAFLVDYLQITTDCFDDNGTVTDAAFDHVKAWSKKQLSLHATAIAYYAECVESQTTTGTVLDGSAINNLSNAEDNFVRAVEALCTVGLSYFRRDWRKYLEDKKAYVAMSA